jgi:hypothetical protein
MNLFLNWAALTWERAREGVRRDLRAVQAEVNQHNAITFTDGERPHGHRLQPNAVPDEVVYKDRVTNPVVGALLNFSDSTTSTWGATISGSGTNHVLGRYNGSVWTVVGK